jgi:Lhr-like helicase
VLERFRLFIFDEAQLIKESGRGFTLESVIALLDHRMRTTNHQIILISAAMGDSGEIAQWLDPEGGACGPNRNGEAQGASTQRSPRKPTGPPPALKPAPPGPKAAP